MLKKLRHKFIVIVMALVGTVLMVVLGSSFAATYHAQQKLIERSLLHTLSGATDIHLLLTDPLIEQDRQGGLLGLLVQASADGTVLQVSDASMTLSTSELSTVVDRVLDDGEAEGRDGRLDLAWMAFPLVDGRWQIAIVDTSSTTTILREQGIRDLQIVGVALLALFGITRWLADWALRPVEAAWDQQRRFVADASHELKTPLAVILANLQILESDEGIDEDARRWVSSSVDEAAHMKTLVNDLLQLARADETAAGVAQGSMRHEDVDLTEMVEAAALEFDAVAFERGCLLDERVEQGVHVTGDPEWLERVVRILIDNACKYAREGTTIDVSLAVSAGHATFVVHNLGTPIDAEDLSHVFDRFWRSDKARSREETGGFGLGLAIAKGVVDAHGGKISATSTADAGTSFTVVLSAL